MTGFLQANGSQVHNVAVLLSPAGEIANLYHKTHFAQGCALGAKPWCRGRQLSVCLAVAGRMVPRQSAM